MTGHCCGKRKALCLGMIAAGLGALALGGARAESLVWTERTSGDLTTLAYGSLDPSKPPLFMLSCFNEMEIVVLDVHHDVEGSAPGDAITIELSSAKGKAPIPGEVAKNKETGATYAEASDIKVKPILEVLRDPGDITITIGKSSATLTDAGRAAATEQFGKACTVL